MSKHSAEERIARLKSVTLAESSRVRMREELSAYADLNAFTGVSTVANPIPSGYFSYFSASLFRITAALLVMVGTLGGTAYASNDALPGETLYPVKINFTEPVQTALIPNTEGKAAWHSILAERRLEEATDLALQGTLDAKTQATLADNFTEHVQDSSEAATQLQQQGNASAALSVRSDLEARITAHENILTKVVNHLAEDGSVDSSSEIATKDLLAVVHQSQDSVEGERLALEDSLSQESSTTIASPASPVPSSASAKVAVQDADTSTDQTHASLATTLLKAPASADQPVESSEHARTTEIAAIMFKNSALLKSLEPAATTTASTTEDTATSTDIHQESDIAGSSTEEGVQSEINIKN